MKHFQYMYTQKSVFDELAVLRQLPVHMRVDLTMSVHETKVRKDQTQRIIAHANSISKHD